MGFRLKCRRCVNGIESFPPPEEADTSWDLSAWHHAKDKKRLPDNVLRSVFDSGYVSFVFHQKSHENKVEIKEDKAEEIENGVDTEEDE